MTHIAGWIFRSPLAAPVWFVLRIYLGAVWLRFGWSKVEDGWLTTDAVGPLLKAIAAGSLPTPLGIYAPFAEVLLGLGVTPLLSIAIPIAELVFAAAFLAGVALVPAAIGATLLNVNLLLAGIAAWEFDGRIIVLQLTLLAAWRVAGELGLSDSLRRLRGYYSEAFRRLRHA